MANLSKFGKNEEAKRNKENINHSSLYYLLIQVSCTLLGLNIYTRNMVYVSNQIFSQSIYIDYFHVIHLKFIQNVREKFKNNIWK